MQNLRILPQNSIDTTYSLLERYRELRQHIKALEREKDAIGDQLKSGYFLDNTDFNFEGRLIATYRPEIHIKLDQTQLEIDLPEIYKEYQKIVEIRKLLLK